MLLLSKIHTLMYNFQFKESKKYVYSGISVLLNALKAIYIYQVQRECSKLAIEGKSHLIPLVTAHFKRFLLDVQRFWPGFFSESGLKIYKTKKQERK